MDKVTRHAIVRSAQRSMRRSFHRRQKLRKQNRLHSGAQP